MRALAVWLVILLLANLNGALREFLLVPLLGAGKARVVSTLLLCALVVFVARLTIRWIAPRTAALSVAVGMLWVGLTLGFEFLAGHYLFRHSWEALLGEYDLASGRIWPFVPLVVLLAPVWSWRRAQVPRAVDRNAT